LIRTRVHVNHGKYSSPRYRRISSGSWLTGVNCCATPRHPDAIAFIQSLPDNAELSIKTTRSNDGKVKEGKFNLGAVSEVRNKIANACDVTGIMHLKTNR
jgi:hypothetical protein